MKKFLALCLAIMMVLSTVSFAAPTLADVQVDVSEIYETAPANQPVAEDDAVLEADSRGVLIGKLDFEKLDTGYVIPRQMNNKDYMVLLSTVGEDTAPAEFPDLYFRITGGEMKVAENTDGTKYASWEFTSNGPGWAKFGIFTNGSKGSTGSQLMPEGVYTMVAKTKWLSAKNGETDVAEKFLNSTFTPNNPNGTWTIGENNSVVNPTNTVDPVTGYKTHTTTLGYYKGQIISNQNNKDFEFIGFGKAAFYIDGGTEYFTSATIAVDDLELYYKAPDVTVTLDDGDASTENTVLRGVAGYTKFDLSKYVLESNTSKAFTGWKIAGTTTTLSNSYMPTSTGEITLVPVYNYYAPGLGFEGPEITSASDLANKVWSNSGEKPTSTNPKFTYDYDVERGVAGFDVNFDEEALLALKDDKGNQKFTFPVRTGFNTHLSKQINGNKVLNTNAIKGIEYKYRMIAPEGASNTYFTSNGHNTKVYYQVNWAEGLEETPCYTGEPINGWHWGECISSVKTMLGKNAAYNGEWLTAYIDLDATVNTAHGLTKYAFWKEADKCSDFRIQFLSDTYVEGDFRLEVDYVRFVLADDLIRVEPDLVSYELYDLRKGYIDLTFTKAITSVPTSDLTALVNGPFTAGVDEIKNADGTVTYRLYSASSVRGKTVSFNEYAYTSTAVIICPEELKNVSKTYSANEVAEKADGENLVPNGDFETPYFNVFYTTTTGALTYELKDGKLYVTHTDKTAEWNSTVVDDVMFKPNTHYYIELDATPTKDSKNNPHADGTTFAETITTYAPVADGMLTLNKNNYNGPERIGGVDYIPSTNHGFQVSMSNFYFKNKFPKTAKVLRIMDADYYSDENNIKFQHNTWAGWNVNNSFFNSPKITIQTCISSGIKAGAYTKNPETGKYSDAEGLQYAIDSFVIKEMFPVYLYDGETLIDTYYAAKDVPIVLPSSTKYVVGSGESVTGWTDGTNTYAPGTTFTLTKPEATTFYVVTECAPLTSNSVSIRTDAYKGIRFMASISNKIKNSDETTEIGYIVTRKVILDNAGLTETEFTADSEIVKVSGKTYVKGSYDKIFNDDGNYTFFTAVLYNIPEEQYDDVLVARPYLVKDGVVTYGAPIATSLKAAATALKGSASYNDLTDEAKAVVDSIVG